jgi:hypothetical protein
MTASRSTIVRKLVPKGTSIVYFLNPLPDNETIFVPLLFSVPIPDIIS